ncbi:ATP-binding protein [Brevibacterium aurantiacum]|uniref:ATP-binding protein n=1 Tax=Brevibacterium aurantiacum TaxID=273384 RepID=UPI0001BC2DA0
MATLRKQAGFPTAKTFESWDEDVSSIPGPIHQALATLEWVQRKENLAICGPAGAGKSFCLEVLRQKIIDASGRVSWLRLDDLGPLIGAHRPADAVAKIVQRRLRSDIVVVDEIRRLP